MNVLCKFESRVIKSLYIQIDQGKVILLKYSTVYKHICIHLSASFQINEAVTFLWVRNMKVLLGCFFCVLFVCLGLFCVFFWGVVVFS